MLACFSPSLMKYVNILITAVTLTKPDRMAELKIYTCILTNPQKEALTEELAM